LNNNEQFRVQQQHRSWAYLGRMTSVDPVVGDPLSGQSWNRYSYVL
jgi:hypothetical protein